MARNYNHRNLILWQRAQELSLRVSRLVERLPRTWTNEVVAKQAIGAASSIGANIAEGHGRYTPGAHKNHLRIARGSAAETDSWLDSLRRAGHITAAEETSLHEECMSIMAMLASKIVMLERTERDDAQGLREEQDAYDISGKGAEDTPPFPFMPEDYTEE